MNLDAVAVRVVDRQEECRFREMLDAHHYLGSLPKIGETLWYVATYGEAWAAVISFSAAALKCGARDRWIGWVRIPMIPTRYSEMMPTTCSDMMATSCSGMMPTKCDAA